MILSCCLGVITRFDSTKRPQSLVRTARAGSVCKDGYHPSPPPTSLLYTGHLRQFVSLFCELVHVYNLRISRKNNHSIANFSQSSLGTTPSSLVNSYSVLDEVLLYCTISYQHRNPSLIVKWLSLLFFSILTRFKHARNIFQPKTENSPSCLTSLYFSFCLHCTLRHGRFFTLISIY